MYSLELLRGSKTLRVGLSIMFFVAALAVMGCNEEVNGTEGIVGLDEAIGKATDPILQPLRDAREAAVDAAGKFDPCDSVLTNAQYIKGCKK